MGRRKETKGQVAERLRESAEAAAPEVEYGKTSGITAYMSPLCLTVSPKFAAVCPALSSEEYAELRESIRRDDIRDPLVVWRSPAVIAGALIIDGHNRLTIAKAFNLEAVPTVTISFHNEDEAVEWIIRNQLARRNLTDEQRARFIARLYKEEKERRGADNAPSVFDDEVVTAYKAAAVAGDSVSPSGKAAEAVAARAGVSSRTVLRAAKEDAGMARIGEVSPGAEAKILAGKARGSVSRGRVAGVGGRAG